MTARRSFSSATPFQMFLLLALVGAGCGDASEAADPQPREGFVGTVAGTDAFIGIVAGEREAMVHVCNGEEEIFEWFEGALDDPESLELDNGAGGSLAAMRDTGGFAGEVTLADGSRHAFTTQVAVGDAGLYRVLGEEADAADLKAGWIVDNDGEQRGALRRGSRFEPAPALPADGLQVGGTRFPVFKIEIDIRPPSPPAGPVPIPYPNLGATKGG